MMSDFLFSLPMPVVIALVVFFGVIAALTCFLCMAAALEDRRLRRYERRMVELNRSDVAERSVARELASWDWDAAFAAEFEVDRPRVRAMDSDGLGS